jgi:hypothetical protein
VEDEDGVKRLCGFYERLHESGIADVALHAFGIFWMRDTFRNFWLYKIGQD